jgi:hypothetical protein
MTFISVIFIEYSPHKELCTPIPHTSWCSCLVWRTSWYILTPASRSTEWLLCTGNRSCDSAFRAAPSLWDFCVNSVAVIEAVSSASAKSTCCIVFTKFISDTSDHLIQLCNAYERCRRILRNPSYSKDPVFSSRPRDLLLWLKLLVKPRHSSGC